MKTEYKYLHFFIMLFITIFIVCDTTAYRMMPFWGTYVPVSGMIIPIVFSLGDIIAEVYGYSISRKLIWNSLACQFIFGIAITIAVHFPTDEIHLTENIHYVETFKNIIRTNITSCMSVTSGMFTNAFLMSKMKVYMNGRNFWVRTILSSSISELVLCVVAYFSLYTGVKDIFTILDIILFVWIYKLIFAVFAAPLVSIISNWLKKKEDLDYYDHEVKYNPFIYNT